jgi:hypothetical protein
MSRRRKQNTNRILNSLKDFQRETVEYVFRRLYTDHDCVDKFLIADEVGLGKTMVARGIIAKAIEHLWNTRKTIEIVYICSNGDIARQNINRLNITGDRTIANATRVTMLPLIHNELFDRHVNFVSFTPGTSFDLKSSTGIVEERVLLYHLLKNTWKFGHKSAYKNIFQVDAGKNRWRRVLDRFEVDNINKNLQNVFHRALKGRPELEKQFKKAALKFSHYKKHVPKTQRRERRDIIGELRGLLAETCIKYLKPDIIILDEFQRFRSILDGGDEVGSLAQKLFTSPDSHSKVLLLSATPYKMYTLNRESEDDDHYRDFIQTVRFLQDSEIEIERLQNNLNVYRNSLYRFDEGSLGVMQKARDEIESILRKVMVRTERLSASEDRDGMVANSPNDRGILTPKALKEYAFIDSVARDLEQRNPVEFWKSAPYILNIMDKTGYKLKEEFDKATSSASKRISIHKTLFESKDLLLPNNDIKKYRQIDPSNAKVRTLLRNTVDRGSWKLLWIPSSMPYYNSNGSPFEENALKDFTKALVFSSWQIVPKVIAMLCSFEAERLSVRAIDKNPNYDTETKRRKPLLRFAEAEGRKTGMPAFTLFYPCVTLASRIDPAKISADLVTNDKVPEKEQVLDEIKTELNTILKPLFKKYNRKHTVDERWYWAALAWLDRHHHAKPVLRWLDTDDENLQWDEMVRTRADDDAGHFSGHIQDFRSILNDTIDDLKKPPADLVDVLAMIALGSPAVTALRSMLRVSKVQVSREISEHAIAEAARIAMGFRTLFNLPITIAVIWSMYEKDELPFWRYVLDYCVSGNLQSVMDEYVHILKESLGLIDRKDTILFSELGHEISKAVSLRTVNFNYDDIQIKNKTYKLESHTLRCRFALRYGDFKDEEGKSITRADQVRSAFNSPFRPFILATTSVGQEGLDFHQYCHSIYHWNLPSNPVDFEQREGRIHRYKGHVIRRNVARRYPFQSVAGTISSFTDVWQEIFERACQDRPSGQNDLTPFWIFNGEGSYKIIRHIPALPLSREMEQINELYKSLVTYRMVFGQPRQEDLLHLLRTLFDGEVTDDLLALKIDLAPRE